MPEVYGIGGNSNVQNQTTTTDGVPVNNPLAGIPLGLINIDVTTSPRTIWTWDGLIWQKGATPTPSLLTISLPNGITPIAPDINGLINFTSTGGTVTITGSTANTVNFEIGGGGAAVEHLTGDTGGQLSPTANNFNIRGQATPNTSGIQVNGSGSELDVRMFSPYALSGFDFTGGNVGVFRPNSGGIVELFVVNQSNTAGSDTSITIQNAGSSGGDVRLAYAITGANAWATGIHTISDASYRISSGGVLGTSDALTITPSGLTSILLGDFHVTRSSPSFVLNAVTNTSTTNTASDAIFQAGVFVGGGDAYLQAGISGGAAWCSGVKQNDAGAYHVAQGSTLQGGTNYFKITTAGAISFPNSGFTNGQFVQVVDTAGTIGTAPINTVGTWTPTLSFGGASTGITYTTRLGDYVRIGQMVFISCTIVLSSKGSATGTALISGLPVTVSANSPSTLLVGMNQALTLDIGYTYPIGIPSTGTTQLGLYECGSGVGPATISDTNFANTTGISFSGIYQIS